MRGWLVADAALSLEQLQAGRLQGCIDGPVTSSEQALNTDGQWTPAGPAPGEPVVCPLSA